jgi:ribosomal protein L35AE/L33A
VSDRVNHPKHYNFGTIEVIDAIEDWGLGFHLGNVVKYVARAPHKGSELEDLKKARWYLERKIQKLSKKQRSGRAVHDKVFRRKSRRGLKRASTGKYLKTRKKN